ncbi:hypothetical protein F5148DRAFT_1186198 [Russula earlei]|uniref:Uncharacterized protein n=1 Tax=Russula earlei TaxID=71964 RepID=A0ACC0UDM4_9AGAM|nr:hypothetical protein F5148DRAFT_1186198 [Russula earlei]
MGWFASLFSSSKSSMQGRRKVLSSTQEAFSLPSPVSAQSGLFTAGSSFGSPEAESTATPSFTYPPPSNGTQYRIVSPGSRKSSLPPTSLLPIHNTPLSPLPQYPPLEQTWARIRTWLSAEYPELGDTLNYGLLPQDLANIEMQFGFSLPQVIRESYLVVDGQEPESSAGCSEGLFFGLHLLPLDEVLEEWRFWREVDDDPNTGAHPRLRNYMQSVPLGWIRKEYSQRGWIPLISDKTGNYVGVDLNPGEGGSLGQVIVFGRDFDTKVVLWRGDGPAGWACWLASFAEVLESGEGFDVGVSNESEGSEDDVGYEGYFFDGTGRGAGDGAGGMSAGGMRLTGEYRGWTTLEAWADKSVRKWQQMGLVSGPPEQEEKGKAPEKVGLGVLDLANTAASSGAEVPIPVFVDVSNTTPSRINRQDVANPDRISQKPSVPVISITKPPAPRPVDLPTHDEISPPSPDLEPHPDDIENVRSLMQEDSSHSRTASDASSPSPQQNSTRTSKLTHNSPSGRTRSPSNAPTTSLSGVTDLLDDPSPALAASRMKPPLPTKRSPRVAPPPLLLPVENSPIEGDESDAESRELRATVRLVGSGGEVGHAPGQAQ